MNPRSLGAMLALSMIAAGEVCRPSASGSPGYVPEYVPPKKQSSNRKALLLEKAKRRAARQSPTKDTPQ